ncbi:MAG: protein-L-isoaspartate(D-aspartate) O-methyltransferase [Deltaproteobacteria bacterium]|nr:protein-L-isoaspartate(D-aspartate) O-methyltransferase [Deltaproteobacteria bacterium]
MRIIPRHLFVPEKCRAQAYEDRPLPIGYQQTISQPYIVGLMLEAVELTGTERVLEVGTGSGYQAALLGWLAKYVYTVEIIPELAQSARAMLIAYENVEVLVANGSIGWKAGAPYDAIIVAAASPTVPPSLSEQLQEGGRLVLPVGEFGSQELLRLRKQRGKVVTENLGGCAFVPLIGEEGWKSGAFSA